MSFRCPPQDSDASSEESERDEDQRDHVETPYDLDFDTASEGGSVRSDFHAWFWFTYHRWTPETDP
jgi:hypothetical protein